MTSAQNIKIAHGIASKDDRVEAEGTVVGQNENPIVGDKDR